MKLTRLLGAFVAFVCLASNGMEIGDILSFAADGGMRTVTVAARSSESTYIGSLDGYGEVLNATISVAASGWSMAIDDWHMHRMLQVNKTANGVSISIEPKPVRRRSSCKTRRLAISEARTCMPRISSKITAGSGVTSGWPFDPVTNEVDVLVVFDKTAMMWLTMQNRSAKAFAETQIAKMNVALANSGLSADFKMALRGAYASSFDVTVDCGRDSSEWLGEALDRVYAGTDSIWREIRNERDRLGADVVMLLANTSPKAKTVDDIYGTVGISFGLEYESEKGLYGLNKSFVDAYREAAYGACDVRIVEIDHTFGHEVGHIMGAGHSDRLSPSYSSPGPQLFVYSSALMYKDVVDHQHYYTVMGYDSTDSGSLSPTYEELPYYSSPLLRNPVTGSVLGDAFHDNVRTIRETFAVVAQYRVRTAAIPADVDDGNFVIAKAWQKARVLRGAAFASSTSNDGAIGIFELKCGRANSKGIAKISATLIGLDGKKTRYRAIPVNVMGAKNVSVTWKDGDNAFTVEISGSDFSGGRLAADGLHVVSMAVGGNLSETAPSVVLQECDFEPGGEVLTELLPMSTGEPIILKNQRWTFAKATSVKYTRGRDSQVYSLVVDASRDRTNRSGMKLSYSAKSGIFRGSFKVYALIGSATGRKRLKKYTIAVTGIVVGGRGYGLAAIRRPPGGPWRVTVE